jgi:hypothetical protein
MDARLQRRFRQLVREQMNIPSQLAAGMKAVPSVAQSFASTQALWRFLGNPRVTLPQLVTPLRAFGRQAAEQSGSSYVLLVHDWSKLAYPGHASKTDQTRLSHADDVGYELYTALLVDAGTGAPLAPMELQLLAADGRHSTSAARPVPRMPHLEQLPPTRQAARTWERPRQIVHVIDREADSQVAFRRWSAADERFLVRADFTRKVAWQDERIALPSLAERLVQARRFVPAGSVTIRGKAGLREVAETEIRLSGPARKRTPNGRIKVDAEPLPLRLVISRVRSASGQVLAEWYLLTNVPDDVPAVTIADWYDWRWKIESCHKLLKSGGVQLEAWRQTSAEALAKRLLIAAMVCVCAWDLQRQTTPAARECQPFLVRLSGRQLKRRTPVTPSALLAGRHLLLPLLDLLEQYTPEQLRALAQQAVPHLRPDG